MSEKKSEKKKRQDRVSRTEGSGKSNKALSAGQKKAIIGIVLVILCIAFVLSIYTPIGSVGVGMWIKKLCMGLFGLAAYVLPVCCMGIFIHMLAHKDRQNRYVLHYIAAFSLVILIATILHLAMQDSIIAHQMQTEAALPDGTLQKAPLSVADCFRAGVAGIGGGFFGGALGIFFLVLFHPVLAMIVVCALAAVCLVVLTKFRISRILFGKLFGWLKRCWDEEQEYRRLDKEEKKRNRKGAKESTEAKGIKTSEAETTPEIAPEITPETPPVHPQKKAEEVEAVQSSAQEELPEILSTFKGKKSHAKRIRTNYNPFADADLTGEGNAEKSMEVAETEADVVPTFDTSDEEYVFPGMPQATKQENAIPVIYGVQIDMQGVRHTDIAGGTEEGDVPFVSEAGQKTTQEDEEEVQKPYEYPTTMIMKEIVRDENEQNPNALRKQADVLVDTLNSFGVNTHVLEIRQGPTVTRFELAPQAGVRVNRITSLADDIALALAATAVRIEAPIPGKAAVGIEIPNKKISVVHLREVLESNAFLKSKSKLSFAVGKDITGTCIVGDIANMPHLLIAGQTGSGKSVCINSLITSIIFKASPSEVKMIMIDPKVVELGVYNGIPHLMIPVVTDPKKAANALAWAVGEMQNRYKMFESWHVRNIEGYNTLAINEGFKPMEQIVIIIDELADLMMVASKEVEDSICRLAQLARAAGMHLIVATQRPSVNVITGVIKANIPSRIAFSVASYVDSRTILDTGGAEKLLGRGDMLYYPSGAGKAIRLQGAFVSDTDVENIVNFVKSDETTHYNEDIMERIDAIMPSGGEEDAGDADEFLSKAIELVVEAGQASTSYLQRRLKVGYSRAGRIMDQMEERGIIGPPDGSKPRAVLISRQEMYDMLITSDEEE